MPVAQAGTSQREDHSATPGMLLKNIFGERPTDAVAQDCRQQRRLGSFMYRVLHQRFNRDFTVVLSAKTVFKLALSHYLWLEAPEKVVCALQRGLIYFWPRAVGDTTS